jgi:hypothetical protein
MPVRVEAALGKFIMLSKTPPDALEECAPVFDLEAPNLRAPSLQALAYVLRHPETWPDRFAFEFESCSRCAMGLAWALWYPQKEMGGHAESWIDVTADNLGISVQVAAAIFLNTRQGTTAADIIAERIEYYLELQNFLLSPLNGSADQASQAIAVLQSTAVLMRSAIEVLESRAAG